MHKFYSGFVSIIGKPNVGKSTLMNCLTGEKIAIVSNKPQTTRNKIQSILTNDDTQIVFIDTPGMHEARSKLGKYMVKSAETALNEVDVVLFLVEPTEKLVESNKDIIEKLKTVGTPVFLVINKIDAIDKVKLLSIIDAYKALFEFKEVIPISALNAENTEILLERVRRHLPEGPKYFPDEYITDQPEKQIAAEIIREKALVMLQDEIPHGIAVEIETMRKRGDKDIVDVGAVIYCEKDSHKGIIIGKQGAMLKEIGRLAREDIENLLGSKVFLQTWVKVKKNWRDDDFLLRNFGYDSKRI